MAKIALEGSLRLRSYEHGWEIGNDVAGTSKGEPVTRFHMLGSYPDLGAALSALLRLKIRRSTAEDVETLRADIAKARAEVAALARNLDGEIA